MLFFSLVAPALIAPQLLMYFVVVFGSWRINDDDDDDDVPQYLCLRRPCLNVPTEDDDDVCVRTLH